MDRAPIKLVDVNLLNSHSCLCWRVFYVLVVSFYEFVMKFETVLKLFGQDPGLVEMLEKQCYAQDTFIVREGKKRFPTTTEVNRGFHRGHAITQLCVQGRLEDLGRMLEVAAQSVDNECLDSKYRQKALIIHVTFLDVLTRLEEKVQKLYPGMPDKASLQAVWAAFAELHPSVAQWAELMFPAYTKKHSQKHKIANQRAMDECATWGSVEFERYYSGLAKQQAARSAQVDAYLER